MPWFKKKKERKERQKEKGRKEEWREGEREGVKKGRREGGRMKGKEGGREEGGREGGEKEGRKPTGKPLLFSGLSFPIRAMKAQVLIGSSRHVPYPAPWIPNALQGILCVSGSWRRLGDVQS